MAKIDIISGFLGAGKTTLIKKLFLSSIKDEKVVLIENEFGEIGIDGSFLKDSGIEIKEINSGCICCSLVGDFATSMKEVITKYNPERIIIEPSGVGKLSDIIKAIDDVDADLDLNIVCTVVDAKKAKMQIKNFGEFLNNQIEHAKTIITSKVDLVDENKLQETLELIKEINPNSNVITTSLDNFEPEDLLKLLEVNKTLKEELIKEIEHEHHHHHEHDGECCCHHEHHEHHHHHEHDEECCCHHEHHEHHHHHEHDEECCCHHEHHEHHHHHEHDEKCCCHHEHHEHHHHHENDEECCCHHEHHEHHHHHEHDEECCCHHEHHHADEVFTSWGIETVYSITEAKLNEFLEFLKNDESIGIILRSKGILKAKDNDSWYYFDYVAGDYSIRKGNPDYTGRIVVIGSKLDTDKIQEVFNGLVK